MPTLAWAFWGGKGPTITLGPEMGDNSRSGHDASRTHCMFTPRVRYESSSARTIDESVDHYDAVF